MRTLVAAQEPSEPKRVAWWPLVGKTAAEPEWTTQTNSALALTMSRRWIAANANSKTEIFN